MAQKVNLVCILSDQLVPNILSVHHYKPEHLIILCSKKMKGKENNFLAALKKSGCDYDNKATVKPFDSLVPFGGLCVSFNDNVENAKESNGFDKSLKLVFNVTGGNKLMTLAAIDYCKKYSAVPVYIDIDNQNEFVILSNFIEKNDFADEIDTDCDVDKLATDCKIDIKTFIASCGFDVLNYFDSDEKQDVEMGGYKVKYEDAIFACNIFAKEGFKPISIFKKVELDVDKNAKKDENLKKEYRFMVNTNILELQSQNVKAAISKIFPWFESEPERLLKQDSKAYGFVDGKWLEYFTYNCIKSFKRELGINDLRCGVELKDNKGEWDVVFTRNQKLYAIECKTGNHDQRKSIEHMKKIIIGINQFRALGSNPILLTISPNASDSEGYVYKVAGFLGCTIVDSEGVKKLLDLVNSNGDAESNAKKIEEILGIK